MLVCPHCGAKINLKKAASELGAKGGKKSKRVLTPEQAREMVRIREEKKKNK